jgi:hypothetical protein
MIYANGLPKSGTHLLCAWLEQNGARRFQEGTYKAYRAAPKQPSPRHYAYMHSHIWPHHYVRGQVITVFRHPRDVLASYAQWPQGKPILEALEGYLGGVPFVEAYRKFLPWKRKGAWVSFEWLLYNCQTRAGKTWSGQLSDWRKVWTPEIEAAYVAAGGLDLEREAGYCVHVTDIFREVE